MATLSERSDPRRTRGAACCVADILNLQERERMINPTVRLLWIRPLDWKRSIAERWPAHRSVFFVQQHQHGSYTSSYPSSSSSSSRAFQDLFLKEKRGGDFLVGFLCFFLASVSAFQSGISNSIESHMVTLSERARASALLVHLADFHSRSFSSRLLLYYPISGWIVMQFYFKVTESLLSGMRELNLEPRRKHNIATSIFLCCVMTDAFWQAMSTNDLQILVPADEKVKVKVSSKKKYI